MRAKIVFPVLAAAIASFAEQASACPQVEPFHLEDVRQADVVFKGRLIGYTTPSRGRSNVDDYAILTVHVDETIKGNVRGNIRLYWGNATFGVPKTMRIRRPVLIGGITAHPTRLRLSSGRTLVYPTLRPDLLHVLEEPCSGPFIIPWTPDNIRDVEAALRGETVEPRDYFAAFRDDQASRPTRYQLKEEAEVAAIGTIVISLTIVLVGIWQSKRRRQGA